MNILITGGAGYIGTELVYTLEKIDVVQQIVIYDNLSRKNHNLFLGRTKLNAKKVRFVQGDILDSRKLKTLVQQADIIYHLAAKVTTPFADHNPHGFDQINHWGTAEVSYLIEEFPVKKLIYTSSTSVYGSSQNEVNALTNPNPKTFYGISKLHGEQHIQRLSSKGIEVYNLRLGNVYGYSKSMRFDSVINKFLFEANFSNHIRIFGNGNQERSFIHIDRLSDLLAQISTQDIPSSTYNCVETAFSVNEIVDELKVIFPQLETTFVHQNMKMRSLKDQPDYRFPNIKPPSKAILGHDLMDFKGKLSF